MPINITKKVVNFTKIPGLLKKELNKIGFMHHYKIIYIMLNKTRLCAV